MKEKESNLEESSPIFNENPELKRHGLCFFTSVLLHILLILGGFHFISPLKFPVYENKVMDVHIASPNKIFIPDFEGEITNSKDPRISSIKRELVSRWGDESEKERAKVPSLKHAEAPEQVKNGNRATRNVTSSFTLGLELPSQSKPDFPSKSELIFYMNPESTKNTPFKRDRGKAPKDLSHLKYSYSPYINMRSGKKAISAGKERGTPGYGGKPSLQEKDYDITPWAEEVVDRIQANWFLSSGQRGIERGTVRISVIIDKNGELSSVRIVNPSKNQAFDQAAIAAVNLSTPFPMLPDNFSDENLEVYFEFQHND